MRPSLIAAPLLAALAGCASPPAGPAGPASGADCVMLFQGYDRIKATMSTPSGRRDSMPIPSDLQLPVQRLNAAGCLTLSAELAPMASLAGPPVADGGAAIPPTSLHAGVVTNSADEAAAMAFFAAHGVNARSVGAPGLGRRIYLGPFQTRGPLDGARDLAVRAGFASPYSGDF